MKNDNCSGFALITVMSVLAILVSTVFLCTYLLSSEPRNDSRQFRTDMKERRYLRALLGRMADQRAGKFVHCGGYFSDNAVHYVSAYASEEAQVYSRRYFRTGTSDYYKQDYRVPSYGYAKYYGFWGGYRGKRYLYPLPSEVWDESSLGCFPTAELSCPQAGWFDGFGQKKFVLHQACYGHWHLGFDDKKLFDYRTKIYITVKDYTHTPASKIRLRLITKIDGRPDVKDSESGWPRTRYHPDYNLHTFYFDYSGEGIKAKNTERMGLHKACVQLQEGDVWVTRFTQPIVVPPWCASTGPSHVYIRELFVEEISYRG